MDPVCVCVQHLISRGNRSVPPQAPETGNRKLADPFEQPSPFYGLLELCP